MTEERPFPQEERRLVTVLFADLVGYTSASETRDPELIQEALSLCFDRLGGGVAMLGALAELSPELHDRLGQDFTIRIGINTGLVVTGAVGPGGYTVTGDAVNVAARLEKATDPGTVLVGDATRRLARRPFRWGERQELTVKGRVEPVVCHRVEELISAPLRLIPAPSDTPFVGRKERL